MKRVILLLIQAVLLLAAGNMAMAQSTAAKKKVAIYVTGDGVDESYKKVVGSKIVTAITKSSEYLAVETTRDFVAALELERDRGLSGAVRDADIAKIGQELGAKFVAVIDVSEILDEIFIAARMIHVETAAILHSCEFSSLVESIAQLSALSEEVAKGLVGSTMGTTTGGLGGVSSRQNKTYTVNGVTFEMVFVKGGSFMMGSADSDAGSYERPVHSETVGDFMIGKTEVTQALWRAVMGSNPSYFIGDNLPVERVSWYDCQTFVNRLSELTGTRFRLPTEAEWEYAARGGANSRMYKYSGSNDPYVVAWYDGVSSGCTHPVASKSPNELGIYDMSGNVYEWTSDLWSDGYSSPRNGGNSGSGRVGRGGGWGGTPVDCRVAIRYSNTPDDSSNFLGLRLAL